MANVLASRTIYATYAVAAVILVLDLCVWRPF